jgi:U-box domain
MTVLPSCNACTNEVDIPHEFICPITQEIMKNPLMSRYGQTYERDAILTWLSKHNNLCPLTRQLLTVSDLIRHRALQARIENWKRLNGTIAFSQGAESDEDEESPSILLTCRKSDFLSYSDHNPKKPIQEESGDDAIATLPQSQQRRLGRRILRLIGSSR